MAVLGLHVFLQRGLNKLQREMCHKTSMEVNSIKTAITSCMETISTQQNTTFIINNPVMLTRSFHSSVL